jgi:hypothetical protein
MFTERTTLVKQEQYQDLLRRAEHERLIQGMTGEARRRAPLFSKVLIRLGGYLVAWGIRLQVHFAVRTGAIHLLTADPPL